nr:MAG TPA: hypothetical protein [Caudoviricetes sp.]DAX15456.1 MAG TPA: hypothetical protein [Bacteriophage sp.]
MCRTNSTCKFSRVRLTNQPQRPIMEIGAKPTKEV